MKSINLTELVDAGATRKTSDGYLIADAKVARTGIQRYAGYELGFADRGVMRVYRPEEEVFKAASLASFAGKPVTNDHPATSVSAEDWKEKAVGHVGNDIARDGEFVRVPFTVMDKATVEQVEGGKRQLSVGYSATLTVEDGFTPEGEPYDAVQRDIKVNHLALVRVARAGSEARIEDGAKWGASPIFDHKEEAIVKTYNIAVGDKAFVVNEDGKEAVDAMKIIVADKDAELAEAQKQANEAQAKADMLADQHNKELDEVKAQIVSDEQLDQLVADRSALTARASKFLGDDDIKGKSVAEIKRACVVANKGADFADGKDDAYISVAFDMLVEPTKVDDLQPAGSSRQETNDSLESLTSTAEEARQRMIKGDNKDKS